MRAWILATGNGGMRNIQALLLICYVGYSTALGHYNHEGVFRNPKILRLLLANNADPSRVDNDGWNFWTPWGGIRALTIEELQILTPYRGINEYDSTIFERQILNGQLTFAMYNILVGALSNTLTTELIDGLANLGATFFNQSVYDQYRMNVHHLVLMGTSHANCIAYPREIISILRRLLQLYPDTHARGPDNGIPHLSFLTTSTYAEKKGMLEIWLTALAENGEDIDEFLRIDNELILARGGREQDLIHYSRSWNDRVSQGRRFPRRRASFSSSSGYSDRSDDESLSDNDTFDQNIFGEALVSEWEKENAALVEQDAASPFQEFWTYWSVPHLLLIIVIFSSSTDTR